MLSFEEIRKRYSPIDLAERAGVKLHGSGHNKYGVCPCISHVHRENTPSFSIYWTGETWLWKCHGNCGNHGDVVDLFGCMFIPGYTATDIRPTKEQRLEAARRLTSEGIVATWRPAPIKKDFLPQWVYEEFLPIAQNVREYCNQRGITDEVIEKYKLGSAVKLISNDDGTRTVDRSGTHKILAIPAFMFGSLTGIKLRRLGNAKTYRYFSYPGSRAGLFGYDDVTSPVLLLKGEICALTAISAGFPACAPTAGERQKLDEILAPLQLSKVVVVGDNDEPGVIAGKERARILDAPLRFPPKEYKDWDEWYLADPKEATAVTLEWLKEVQ